MLKFKITYLNFLYLMAFGIYICVVGSFFGYYFYLADLISHFYLQYFVIAIILLILFIFKKNKKGIYLTLVITIYLAYYLFQVDLNIINYQANIIKDIDIYFINAHYQNYNLEPIINDIKIKNPKYLAIVELNNELSNAILQEFKYKNYYINNGNGAWRMGFFTNENIMEHKYISSIYDIGYFKIEHHEIYLIHPAPPLTPITYNLQKEFFQDLINKINLNSNFIILGDFNSTFYSANFKYFFGKYNYYPVYSWGINTLLRIPIDYAISDAPFQVIGGKQLSSDHVPLYINFKTKSN